MSGCSRLSRSIIGRPCSNSPSDAACIHTSHPRAPRVARICSMASLWPCIIFLILALCADITRAHAAIRCTAPLYSGFIILVDIYSAGVIRPMAARRREIVSSFPRSSVMSNI